MKSLRFVAGLFAIIGLGLSAPASKSHSSAAAGARVFSSSVDIPFSATIDNPEPKFVYSRPTEKMKVCTYVFDLFGPYPIFGAALIAGIDQADKHPPAWGDGAKAYVAAVYLWYPERFGAKDGLRMGTTTSSCSQEKTSLWNLFTEDRTRCSAQFIAPRFLERMQQARGTTEHKT